MNITGSYPSPTNHNLSTEHWEFFSKLPKDYKQFLYSYNGGYIEDDSYCFEADIPFKRQGADAASIEKSIREFFGFPTNGVKSKKVITEQHNKITQNYIDNPEDILENNIRHEGEYFLPSNIIVFAICADSSLLCISLRKSDFGNIYLWNYYWNYPWHEDFYFDRIEAEAKKHKDIQEITDNDQHPLHIEMSDRLNYATIVKVSQTFTEFLSQCTPCDFEEEEEEDNEDTELDFSWNVERIKYEIIKDEYHGHHICLERDIPDGHEGWTMTRIQLPERRIVESVSVSNNEIILTLNNAEQYSINSDNLYKFDLEFLEAEGTNDAVLENIWVKLAGRKTSAF